MRVTLVVDLLSGLLHTVWVDYNKKNLSLYIYLLSQVKLDTESLKLFCCDSVVENELSLQVRC